ncbi:23S rRNA (guanosine(2251)-2'-O)-methyltransferase RlmB [Fulvivirgaceae bacterium BMA10]|uniref:23S rRNA (Guanosine(2251)-2'-O)-methyltransferase RlmB n=1 Tax=Splendidivirga corallicola TaxID=3051826 RepID=A0ABT8KJ31_9BACT|nr:23S rRNA (guanosine(2251)-2'-O)-methyltransferase RlmB [Fulvivirgaceae bacterium BMA10]
MEKRKKGYIRNDKAPSYDKQEIIFGTRAIIEAIRAGKEIEKLLIQKGLKNELISELVSIASSHKIPFTKVPIEKLNRITRKNHQGAICFLSAITYASLDNIINACFEKGKSPFIILLDRITDVRNLGAIARSAECAGVDALVVPDKGNAQITSDAMKTSAGALNFLPVCREHNLKSTIQYLKDSGVHVLACTEKTDQLIYASDLNQPVAILLGSEENGISPEYLKLASACAKIPLHGNIASLNVSVAAGIAIFETVRQRGQII